jgi:hypothetical protein
MEIEQMLRVLSTSHYGNTFRWMGLEWTDNEMAIEPRVKRLFADASRARNQVVVPELIDLDRIHTDV